MVTQYYRYCSFLHPLNCSLLLHSNWLFHTVIRLLVIHPDHSCTVNLPNNWKHENTIDSFVRPFGKNKCVYCTKIVIFDVWPLVSVNCGTCGNTTRPPHLPWLGLLKSSPNKVDLWWKSRTLPRHINVLQEVCVGVWRGDCDLQNEMSVTAWYGLRNGQCYLFHRHRRGLPLMHVTNWPSDNNSPQTYSCCSENL